MSDLISRLLSSSRCGFSLNQSPKNGFHQKTHTQTRTQPQLSPHSLLCPPPHPRSNPSSEARPGSRGSMPIGSSPPSAGRAWSTSGADPNIHFCRRFFWSRGGRRKNLFFLLKEVTKGTLIQFIANCREFVNAHSNGCGCQNRLTVPFCGFSVHHPFSVVGIGMFTGGTIWLLTQSPMPSA